MDDTSDKPRPLRKLSQGEYRWMIFDDQGAATRGDLYVDEEGTVKFLTASEAAGRV